MRRLRVTVTKTALTLGIAIGRSAFALGITVGTLAPLIPATAQEIVAPAIRDVTPPGFTPAPRVDGPLIREPVPPKPPEPPRWHRYFLPVTTDSATFSVRDGLLIRIAGVTPPGVDEMCTRADGPPWPCGRAALAQFRQFLRGRAVECLFPYSRSLEQVVAPCRVGTTDLGLWLLKMGWARISPLGDDDYIAAVAEARCARRGLWQSEAPPDVCP